jgi:hypothetical protein
MKSSGYLSHLLQHESADVERYRQGDNPGPPYLDAGSDIGRKISSVRIDLFELRSRMMDVKETVAILDIPDRVIFYTFCEDFDTRIATQLGIYEAAARKLQSDCYSLMTDRERYEAVCCDP